MFHASCFPYSQQSTKGVVKRSLLTFLYLLLILTIMIQLKPEIYRLIVKALISSDDDSKSRSSANSKQPPIASSGAGTMIGRDQQASLATLMRVSNVSIWLLRLIRD
jgi:hypothetical protein